MLELNALCKIGSRERNVGYFDLSYLPSARTKNKVEIKLFSVHISNPNCTPKRWLDFGPDTSAVWIIMMMAF